MKDDSSQYDRPFLNQYVKIPDEISDKLDLLYSGEYEGVRHCVGLIIVNLLEFKEIAYSRDKNFYSENHTKEYTYANMLNAVEIAALDAYAVKLMTGYRSPGFKTGFASTIGAGPRLGEFSRSQKMELDVASLPLLLVNKRPMFCLEDLDVARARCLEGSPELRAFSDRLDRIYDESLKLNRDYWNKMILDVSQMRSKQKCFNSVGLTRILNADGEMGRWHQRGEMSFQQLPEAERKKLLLNGEEVAEIDYSAMHPHILYAWEKQQCPDDFYGSIMRRCGCSKFVAKSVALIAINSHDYKSLVGAINNNKGETERANRRRAIPEPVLYCELKNSDLDPLAVVDAIAEAHQPVANHLFKGEANKLMLEESDIMTSVLLKLMGLGIPALPIHDSVLVPSQHKNVARQIMQDTYKERTGFDIVLK